MAILFWLGGLAADGILAQGALARFGWSRVTPPEMGLITLPPWTSVAFAAALVAALVGKGPVAFAGVNLALILAAPLCLGGLAVVHCLAQGVRMPRVFLIGFYGLVFGSGPLLVLVVVLGIVEQFAGLRERILRRRRKEI